MNIHEYQAKQILKSYGLPVPRGIPAFSADDAVKAAQSLGGSVWVVKAQIHARGLGKALKLGGAQQKQLAKLVSGLYRAFTEKDMSLLEINPLILTKGGD